MPHTATLDIWQYVKPFMRYLDDLMACACFPDLLETKVFPNGKEMTESMAAYHVVRNKLRLFDLADPSVEMFAVADGRTPRTAALFAYRTAWSCHSIDPTLKGDKSWNGIKRLSLHPCKIEEFAEVSCDKAFVACVHSHADLSCVCEKIKAKTRLLVSIPCCVKQERERKPDIEYIDRAIWSPCNVVKIWIDGVKDAEEA